MSMMQPQLPPQGVADPHLLAALVQAQAHLMSQSQQKIFAQKLMQVMSSLLLAVV